ncbi:MAG: ArnT family glycosyltransferase [Acidobacteriota bacterium]
MERRYQLIVVLVAAIIYLGCMVSPPGLMDDVDAVQAQIAANMLTSGDWVTARLNGVAYLEKSPLIYWSMAASYAVFGIHDWAARIPLALSVIALCWLTARMARWAFDELTGLYAGLILATSVGLWLFTRIQIPDAMLTATIALALWAFLRAMEGERRWAYGLWAAMGTGLLLKGLIAIVFPVAAIGLWMTLTRSWGEWRRLAPGVGVWIAVCIAAPWHVAAAMANPPLFDFTMHSGPGEYHGFFWFYFFNEHVFRFLNMRWPRDYNTVPRALFWAFHLLWLFPWSAFFPGLVKLSFRGEDRGHRTRLLALCFTVFLLTFFTFSTTQEYYSMPCYPALALLLANVLREQTPLVSAGRRVLAAIAAAALAAVIAILTLVRNLPTPGDISNALTLQATDAYTLSLGHMGDLTLASFAYLRLPLVMAGAAFLIGAAGAALLRGVRLALALAVLRTLVFHAARVALITVEPYRGSRALAEAYQASPPGQLIIDNQYYTFASVFFYANNPPALLLNGRVNNLEYGSYAPGAPAVFLDYEQFAERWKSPARYYLAIEGPALKNAQKWAGRPNLHLVLASGGKMLYSNQPVR